MQPRTTGSLLGRKNPKRKVFGDVCLAVEAIRETIRRKTDPPMAMCLHGHIEDRDSE
jgi:hypothetical protein